ncbi:hypothetical protein B0A49_04254 [Cryomyces minteri]|uniref:Uncharacterized protein n=1 Tax=Cryomyces minteri TaxID=331657 RepID=A0A4U0XBD4_9PEZI|nr:hypothetical protein B0A49_04254 [Cryomyces minteri]
MSLSQRDTEVLALAWQCFETEPKIDYDKLAQLANYKTLASARVCFGGIKKKVQLLAAGAAGDAGPTPTSTAKGATSGAGKRKNVTVEVPATSDDADAAPAAKKGRGRPRKAAKVEHVADEAEKAEDVDGAVKLEAEEEGDTIAVAAKEEVEG